MTTEVFGWQPGIDRHLIKLWSTKMIKKHIGLVVSGFCDGQDLLEFQCGFYSSVINCPGRMTELVGDYADKQECLYFKDGCCCNIAHRIACIEYLIKYLKKREKNILKNTITTTNHVTN